MPTAFARNIKALRESKGLTQEELAGKILVERNTVVRWENGKVTAPRQPEIIEKLKDLFNVSDADLFGYNDGYFARTQGARALPEDAASVLSVGVRKVPVCSLDVVKTIIPGEPLAFSDETMLYEELAEKHPNCFAVQMSDACKNLNFTDRNMIFVDPDLQPVDGSIAVVSVDDGDAMVRRVRMGDGSIRLVTETTDAGQWEEIVIADANHEVRFIGTVFWWQSSKEGE